jgi:DNA invertase Pin-like site-specific DNA recombinase
MKRAAIYARVSTNNGQNPEMQLGEVRQYCSRRGWQLVQEYADKGILVNALEEFRALGIDFVSLHEGVDTSTPNGRLVFGIFASIAEFERELIRDRVKSGLALAESKGKRLGRPRVSLDFLRVATL